MPNENILTVTFSVTLLPVLPQILARVRHLFDLQCDPEAINEILDSMNNIQPGLFIPGTRVSGCFDSFELSVRAVLGQQITVKSANILASKLVAAYGTPIETGIDGLTHIFPLPEDILSLDGEIANHLGVLGIISVRSKTILELARLFSQKQIDFDHCLNPEIEIKKLMDIPGIGSWTATYIAMRAMGWTNAFLETDASIKKALAPRTPKEILEISEAWQPWRSYATISLWNSLQDTNQED